MSKYFNPSQYLPAVLLFISIVGIYTTKTLTFSSAKIFYLLFLISFITLFALLLKAKKDFLKRYLILLAPTQLFLLFSHITSHKLHWIFDLFLGTWLLLIVLYIIQNWHKKHTSTHNAKIKYSPTTIIILIVVMFAHFGFGFYHLGKAAYVDERLWTYSNEKRIEKYWNNILEMDWKHTRPSDKPGVTLAILSGPSLLFTMPSDFKKEIPDKQAFENMLFTVRLPILIFSTFAIFLFFIITTTLFGEKTGLLTAIFTGLSPILLGMSRIINPDALSWIFIPLTTLSFFVYLKNRNVHWVYSTGILFGLGLLTKYIANIIFLFFPIVIFLYPLFFSYNEKQLREYLRSALSASGIITLIALSTFYILFPGVWVKLDRLLIGTIWSQPFEPIWKIFVLFIALIALDYFTNKSKLTLQLILFIQKFKKVITAIIPLIFIFAILAVFYHTYLKYDPINFEHILTSPKTAINSDGSTTKYDAFITSFYVLFFGTNPFIILGSLLASFSLLRGKNNKFNAPVYFLMFFIIFFYIGSLFSTTIPTVRYQIILFPIIFVIASYGLVWFTENLSKKIIYPLIFIIIICNTFTLYKLKPFYFSFNSPLLPKNHLINPKDMGDGNYEVAQYLNSLPNAKELNVWSDKRGVCTFFKGKCVSVIRKKDFIENGPHYNYFVISKGREARTVNLSRGYSQMRPDYPVRLDLLYTANPQPIYELHPGNRDANYIKVIPWQNTDVWREKH